MDKAFSPLVSLIVISMNHAKYVKQCMESILHQDYENFEILYLDNDSHDFTYEKGMALLQTSPKLTYHLKQTTKEGVCKNANHLVSHATGKYCAFISADDFMLPGRITNQINVLKKLSPEYGVVFSDALLIDDDDNYLPQTFIQRLGRDVSAITPIYKALLQGNFVPAMTTLVDLSLLKEVGGFDESLIYEDFDMWLKLSRKCKFFFMNEPQAVYRVTPNSLEKTMGEKGLTDKIDIYYKQLSENEYKSLTLEKIGAYTNHLYNYDYSSFRAYAKKYLRRQFNLKTTIFLFLNLLHIPLFKVKP